MRLWTKLQLKKTARPTSEDPRCWKKENWLHPNWLREEEISKAVSDLWIIFQAHRRAQTNTFRYRFLKEKYFPFELIFLQLKKLTTATFVQNLSNLNHHWTNISEYTAVRFHSQSFSEFINLFSDERRFSCSFCNKAFRVSHHLKEHISSLHSNEKNFICLEKDCLKKFSSKLNLYKHSKVHKSKLSKEN